MFVLGVFYGYYDLEGYIFQVCVLIKCFSMEELFCGIVIQILLIVFKLFYLMGNFLIKVYVFLVVLVFDVEFILVEVMSILGNVMSVDFFNKFLVLVVFVGRVFEIDYVENQ